jgi:hypothetical protein
MGITNSFAKFLLLSKKSGADFSHTITLGRLRLYTDKPSLNKAAQQLGLDLNFNSLTGDKYAERFFNLLGAETADSLDYSDYEQANVIHDLNQPLPHELHGKYTAIIDSGTLEHVFNFPVAIKSCMDALAKGGFYIGITPSNNLLGHGFYQFSPELFFRIFSPANGFTIHNVMLGVLGKDGEVEKWYTVKDPAEVKSRVTIKNFKETFLFVAAQKTEQKDIDLSSTPPLQSDYAEAWRQAEDGTSVKTSAAKMMYKKYVPGFIQSAVQFIRYKVFSAKRLQDDFIGVIDSRHIQEINL